MTERWQRELSKLRAAELPGEVWDRAQRGPTGDGLSPRRERIVAGAVAIAVFVAAGSFAWQALREAGPTPGGARSENAAIALDLVGGTPRVTMSYAGITIEGITNSFSFGNGIYDTLGVDFSGAVFFPVPQATSVTISGSASSVNAWLADRATLERLHTLEVNDGGTAIDAEPGRYALAVTGGWDEGKVTFYFPLEITAPGQQPPVAVLRFASDGSAALTSEGTTVKGTRTEADLKRGGVSVQPLPATVAPQVVEVALGTQVWLPGDRPPWLSVSWFQRSGDNEEQTIPYGAPAVSTLGPGEYQLLVGSKVGNEAVGNSFSIRVVQPQDDPIAPDATAGLRVVGTAGGPSATLSFNGSSLSGDRGTYCWNANGSGVCADAVPFGLPDTLLDIPLGTRISFAGDFGSVQASLSRLDAGRHDAPAHLGEIRTLEPGEVFPLPADQGAVGVYELDLFATWPQGDAQFQFGIRLVAQASASPSRPTDAARIACAPSGATMVNPTVAAQPDGVHLFFENPTGAKQFELHRPSDPGASSQGGRLDGATTTTIWALEPGPWLVACVNDPRHQSSQDVATASFTVVDPGGYWIPWELTCAGGEVHGRTPVVGDFYGLDPQAASVAFAPFLRGLRADDLILEPLYRPASFKVPTYVVEREGVVVARLSIIRSLQLTMCRGSHIDVVRAPNQALACLPEERVLFSGPEAFLLPGGAAYVRGNVIGVRQTDEVVQVSSRPSGEWDGTWAVIRDGAVIALVDVPAANGTACSGSGIGGSAVTPSPLPAS
jgi:hypothetical protein